MESCTFCGSKQVQEVFRRDVRIFLKCQECSAFTVQNPPVVEHWEQYEEGEFSDRIEEMLGDSPDFDKWDEFSGHIKGSRVLEVGPGTGHFLAAGKERGFQVFGIELSQAHRDYILQHWKIKTSTTFADFADQSIDVVCSFNCIEHISDLAEHMHEVFRVLRPGGVFIVSTCNGAAFVPRVVGKWWSMFRTVDHLSISTPEGLRRLGKRTGMPATKIWTNEYPLETLLSLGIALREWHSCRRTQVREDAVPQPPPHERTSRGVLAVRKLSQCKLFLPVGATFGMLGLANSIKAVFQKPMPQSDNSVGS